MSRPPNPPPMMATSTSSNTGSRVDGLLHVRVVVEGGVVVRDLEVLLVAVLPDPLVALVAVALAQLVGIELEHLAGEAELTGERAPIGVNGHGGSFRLGESGGDDDMIVARRVKEPSPARRGAQPTAGRIR